MPLLLEVDLMEELLLAVEIVGLWRLLLLLGKRVDFGSDCGGGVGVGCFWVVGGGVGRDVLVDALAALL
eukprot:CAMPEP_0194438238 /NCGR_PEP_ID=MMETSP0176-20130528/103963_1 /TAXON_ID=216777 /ORGANISM="Proboscia alata, Strain PI-D3" /LENGTH=68 /DNA_ID=CAMNT_0039260239 /DNA_START=43 /DNA_END=245 /DNA_ORIENTATION=-